MSGYRIVPMTVSGARKWIAQTHRHLQNLQGGLFAAGVAFDGDLVGVSTAGRGPRMWEGTGRIVITRAAVLPGLPPVIDSKGEKHSAPACSMLYGALVRAATQLGWREAWSYTLPGEDGRSLRAAGFTYQGETRDEDWDRPSRSRTAAFPGAKGRWMRPLERAEAACQPQRAAA